MKRTKKTAGLFALLLWFCSLCAPFAVAAEVESPVDEKPPVDFQYIVSSRCNLEITNGVANIVSSVRGTYGSTTECKIELKLQKKVLFWWSTVETWEKTAQSYQATLSATNPVTSGKTYRAVAEVTVWNGSSSESTTVTSASVEAP